MMGILRELAQGRFQAVFSLAHSLCDTKYFLTAAPPRCVVKPASRRLSSAREWCDYFHGNTRALLDIPWARGAEIAEAERAAIAASIQGFQLGESSEGRHFLRAAQVHAWQTGDPDYVEAVRLLIGEEQRHARDLGRYMDLAAIPRIRRTWPDSVFRWLRRRAGLELTVSVLVTAEIIAAVYYVALREATGSPVLRRLCEQILRDEVEHIRFQTDRLALLRMDRAPALLGGTHGLHRCFFGGTCLVVWWKHGRTLKAGGFGWRRFWREAWREMNAALASMDPRAYSFPTSLAASCEADGPRAGGHGSPSAS
jgi:hypothetical protein